MTPRQLLRQTASAFRQAGIPDPEVDASLILSYVTGREPLDLRLDMTTSLTEDVLQRFQQLSAQRLTRRPLQYLLGRQSFLGRDFLVNESVLIPRPETELLAEKAIQVLRHLSVHPTVLDLCCGSGALAVSMALEVSNAVVTASDLSNDALAVAKRNAEQMHADVHFLQGDLFVPVQGMRFDVIVSNPPYIPSEECRDLQTEVMQEPLLALDGGRDGLDFYRRIAHEAADHLLPGGVLLLEVGYGEAETVAAMLSDYTVQIHEDYQHIPRMIEAKFNV